MPAEPIMRPGERPARAAQPPWVAVAAVLAAALLVSALLAVIFTTWQ